MEAVTKSKVAVVGVGRIISRSATPKQMEVPVIDMNEQKPITVLEAIKTDKFRQLVEKELEKISKSRQLRPEPKPGFRYKRNWLDQMKDQDIFKGYYFVANAESVLGDNSNLGSEFRNAIKLVCLQALSNYFK